MLPDVASCSEENILGKVIFKLELSFSFILFVD